MALDPTLLRKAAPAASRPAPWWRPRARLAPRERRLLLEQLALMLDTGTALHAALDALTRQPGSAVLRGVVTGLRDDLAAGRTFSQALAGQPHAFDGACVNLVAAAEQGGFLPEVLAELVRLEERREALHKAIVAALAYPALLLALSLGVVVFVLVGVFPRFGALFQGLGDQLPPVTRLMLAASEGLRQHWPWLALAVPVLAAAVHLALRRPALRARLDRLWLSLPGLGPLLARLQLLRVLRVMGLSLQRGVPIVAAIRASREVVANRAFRALMADLDESVQSGSGLAPAFQRSPFVPPLAAQMLATAEASGRLPPVMLRLADHYETALARQLQLAGKLAEPVMLLVMGAMVGLIVSGLILPIFRLSRVVH